MKKITSLYRSHPDFINICVGLLFSFLIMMPYLILGTASIITYHDQLDGELLNYILSARYFFTNTQIYPEILSGLPATGAPPLTPVRSVLPVSGAFFRLFAFTVGNSCYRLSGHVSVDPQA